MSKIAAALLLTIASVPALAADAVPDAATVISVSLKSAPALELVSFPIDWNLDFMAVHDAYFSPDTPDDERALILRSIVHNTERGVTYWGAVRTHWLRARGVAMATNHPIVEPPVAPHHSPFIRHLGRGLSQVAGAMLVVGVGGYVGAAENTYHTSSSYTDGSGHTTTVRCSTYANGNTVINSCN